MTSHDDDSLAAFLEEPACPMLNKGVLITLNTGRK